MHISNIWFVKRFLIAKCLHKKSLVKNRNRKGMFCHNSDWDSILSSCKPGLSCALYCDITSFLLIIHAYSVWQGFSCMIQAGANCKSLVNISTCCDTCCTSRAIMWWQVVYCGAAMNAGYTNMILSASARGITVQQANMRICGTASNLHLHNSTYTIICAFSGTPDHWLGRVLD